MPFADIFSSPSHIFTSPSLVSNPLSTRALSRVNSTFEPNISPSFAMSMSGPLHSMDKLRNTDTENLNLLGKIQVVWNAVSHCGWLEEDTYLVRLRKTFAVRLHLTCLLLTLCIILPYLHRIARPPCVANMIYAYIVLFTSLLSLLVFSRTKRLWCPQLTALGYGLAIPYIAQICNDCSVGHPSGYTSTWPMAVAVAALAMGTLKQTIAAVIMSLLPPLLHTFNFKFFSCRCPSTQLDDHYDQDIVVHRLMHIAFPLVVSFAGLLTLVSLIMQVQNDAAREARRANSLLLHILPQDIADQLKYSSYIIPGTPSEEDKPAYICSHHRNVTVLFADLVNFTEMSECISPEELVRTLNNLFGSFDSFCIREGVEKIKTIGDCYMCVGFPCNPFPAISPTDEEIRAAALRVIRVGIRMLLTTPNYKLGDRSAMLRIGANSGPVVAGVIGYSKFCFDLWGPTVNVASRLESSGLPGHIQISKSTKDLLGDRVEFKFRDQFSLKGVAGLQDRYLISASEGQVSLDIPMSTTIDLSHYKNRSPSPKNNSFNESLKPAPSYPTVSVQPHPSRVFGSSSSMTTAYSAPDLTKGAEDLVIDSHKHDPPLSCRNSTSSNTAFIPHHRASARRNSNPQIDDEISLEVLRQSSVLV